jgi:hypothetical protein
LSHDTLTPWHENKATNLTIKRWGIHGYSIIVKTAGMAQLVQGGATGSTAGVRFPIGARSFSSPHRSDWLWDPDSLLSNMYVGLIS